MNVLGNDAFNLLVSADADGLARRLAPEEDRPLTRRGGRRRGLGT
jgi:hypothetical protein